MFSIFTKGNAENKSFFDFSIYLIDGKKLESVNLVAVKKIDSKGFISSAFEAIGFYIYSFFMQDEVN